MDESLLVSRRSKEVIGLAIAVAAVGAAGFGVTMFAMVTTKYLIMVCGAAIVAVVFLLLGNPRLFLLYSLFFLGTLQIAKKAMYLGHVGGATGFDLTISDPFLLGLLAFQVRDWMQGHHRPYRVPPIVMPWLVLMGLGLYDVATENFQTPVAHELWHMGRTLLWILVVTNEVVRRRQFLHVAAAILAAAAFHAAVATIKDILGVQLGLENYGELSAEAIDNLARSTVAGETDVRRVSGLQTHPILLGAYLVMSISTGFALLFAPVSMLLRAAITIVVGLTTVVVVMTLSRGAWMDFCVAFASVLILTHAHPRARARYFLARSAIVAGIFLLIIAFSGQIVARITRSGEHSASSRWEFMVTAFDMVKAKPLFGFGLNNYVFDQPPFTEYGTINGMTKKWGELPFWPVVHSTWMIVWSEQGTVGLLVFLWFHWIVIRVGFRNLGIRDPTLNALNVGLLCGVFAIMADGAVSFLLRTPISVGFYAVTALIMALAEWRKANELDGQRDGSNAREATPGSEAGLGPWLPAGHGSWLANGAGAWLRPRLRRDDA